MQYNFKAIEKLKPLQFAGYQTNTQMIQPWVGFIPNFRVKNDVPSSPLQ